jgi:phosphatidate cytidylyltransferase
MGAFVGEMRRYEKPGGVMVNLALTVFALVYVGLLLSFMIQLRVLGGSTLGMLALAGMIVVVKMGDIGAYAIGRLLGRHKMAPKLSPGKTIEGAIGGLVFSCLGAYFLFQYLMPRLDATSSGGPPFAWLVFGVVVGAAGMIGDLAESLFKRDMGVKDSSAWMPGFGGVLDLIDSTLVAAPVAYLCWTLLVGPGI